MKAMILNQYGDDALFERADVERPEVTAGHLLVRIEASSVNTVDTMIRRMGPELPLSPALPAILGMDVAGTVEAVGDRVEILDDLARLAHVLEHVTEPGALVLAHAAYESTGLAVRAAVLAKPGESLQKTVDESITEAPGRPFLQWTQIDQVANDGKVSIDVRPPIDRCP